MTGRAAAPGSHLASTPKRAETMRYNSGPREVRADAQNTPTQGVQRRTSAECASVQPAWRALFTVFAIRSAVDRGLPAKEPNQEPTQADFRRHPATPGDCQAWSSAH